MLNTVLSLVIYVVAIYVAWWALMPVKWESVLNQVRSPQAAVLRVLVAVVFGSLIAQFFLEYIRLAQALVPLQSIFQIINKL
ncbi:DUF1146 domain-containing protein [Exiguobacterium sp. SH3S2]|uniref:DUF1146 family protein n=1 Tax=unclassified Exiguobacterium TaxID=2644629 RepID=UPI00103AF079|nr:MULTISPECIES: DUF1146 family protein [unclassified Exiguobacterium]TCI24184.1 DUF1146 domain-containing protein [Exiguobacterium sp. SH5S4]TCI36322.1 DUF1146 domain-containing protein [Exiguobacterium sp. SH4S7]TCI42193.1 DUF1146 domain-containing protein [Exiguobacterium sp. SH3S3]TCI48370.1 DUF1146 domain-containing protein [Exiguobacterium sp. SH5S32]TCI50042.1 DUF1146 domain-containing protein [Exiguobacterium sp. SH5S13]